MSVVAIEDEGVADPERTCAGCRQRDARDALLRFSVARAAAVAAGAPQLVPDPKRRLPGRGVSVHPTRECVRRAAERGGFARALGAKLTLDAESLCGMAGAQYARRLEGLLLAAQRSGALVAGTDAVRRLLAEAPPPLLLVAEDAAGRREEIAEHAARLGGRCVVYGSKEELGRLLGRAEVGVLALLEAGIAAQVATTAARATELAARGDALGSVTPPRVAPGRVSEAE